MGLRNTWMIPYLKWLPFQLFLQFQGFQHHNKRLLCDRKDLPQLIRPKKARIFKTIHDHGNIHMYVPVMELQVRVYKNSKDLTPSPSSH